MLTIIPQGVENLKTVAARIPDSVHRAGYAFVCLVMLFILLFLTVSGFTGTTDMNTANEMQENAVLIYDNIPLQISATAVFVLLLYLVWQATKSLSPELVTGLLIIWVLAVGLLWIFSAKSSPTHDSYIVTNASFRAAQGDYAPLENKYFKDYFPYQLGYVLFNEVFIRLLHLGEGSFAVLQYINIIFLAVSYYAIMRISCYIFKSKRARIMTAVLLALCIQPVLFSTFLYGIIPGFAFAMLSVWLLLLFLRSGRWYAALLSALCIGAAVCIKLNFTIVLTAEIIMVALRLLKKEGLKSFIMRAVYIIAALACTLSMKSGVTALFEARSGVEFGGGIPIASWAAMGLSESDIQPGWYNSVYTRVNFDENGDGAASASLETVKNRLETFAAHTDYRNGFFYKKVLSQWNEPTYQSIWTNQVRGHTGEYGVLAGFVCEDGESAVKGYMNIFVQLVFCFAAGACILCLKNKNEAETLLLLIIFGGFLYHFIFEAKSQYILIYFILMLPLCAHGLCFVYAKARRAFNGRKKAALMSGRRI